MVALPNVFHFFAHKLASLSAGRFALTLVFACSFDWFFFWHNKTVSPLVTCLDVEDCVRGFGNGCLTKRNDPVHTAKGDMRSEQYSLCERIGLLPNEWLTVMFPNGDTRDKQS